MSIPREAMQRAVDAGHPDTALVGVPISLLREILRMLPVETLVGAVRPTAPEGSQV